MSLKDLDIFTKAQRLQQQLIDQGLIKDRKYKLKTYKQCFIGKEIIPIIIEMKLIPISVTNKTDNEQNAVKFGNQLMQSDIIKHVTRDHTFKNDKLFYEFITGYNNKNDSGTKRRGSVDTSQIEQDLTMIVKDDDIMKPEKEEEVKTAVKYNFVLFKVNHKTSQL